MGGKLSGASSITALIPLSRIPRSCPKPLPRPPPPNPITLVTKCSTAAVLGYKLRGAQTWHPHHATHSKGSESICGMKTYLKNTQLKAEPFLLASEGTHVKGTLGRGVGAKNTLSS